MRDLEADKWEKQSEKLGPGCPQQEGQQAPKWEGMGSVVQGDHGTLVELQRPKVRLEEQT